MNNPTQLERYKKLIAYIDEYFKEDINIAKVESVCHYSYRNINRIFQALHHETIGKYVRRIRLEKAAQYLKYSDTRITDIADEVGFENVSALTKAFKNRFYCTPSAFRKSNESIRSIMQESLSKEETVERQRLAFELEYLDDFEYLFLEYRGSYDNYSAVMKSWDQLVEYASMKELIGEDAIFFAEISDDNEISDSINFRTNLAVILKRPLPFVPDGLFITKVHKRQKYAKFTHKGSYASMADRYNEIYAFWMVDVLMELEDLPTLEFYLNHEEDTDEEDLLTEIYIPVQ